MAVYGNGDPRGLAEVERIGLASCPRDAQAQLEHPAPRAVPRSDGCSDVKPTSVVKKIMFSAAQAGYANVSFAVNRIEKGE